MPTRAKRPCRTPGCAGHAERDGYCQACVRRTERERGSAAQRGYGHRWRKLRLMYLRAHPLCAECGAPATDVHHLRPKAAGGPDAWDNLQSLCHACHSRVTAADAWGRA